MAALDEPWVWEIRDLRSARRATQLLETVHAHPGRAIVLDLSRVRQAYPNGAIPFAAALSHLRETSGCDIRIRLDRTSPVRHIADPLTLRSYDRMAGHTLTNSVWRYDTEEDAQRLTNMFVEALTDQVHCEEGVIDSITWCLYEVMDNVFQHSNAPSGFVMMQLHRENRRCALAVADTGIGIQKSLFLTKSAPIEVLRDPGESINHALQQGVTSKGGQNQGNGLFGLRRAVEINGGQLSVRSGWGEWTIRDGQTRWHTNRQLELVDIEDHQSTLVDWQLDCSQVVKIDEALGRKRQQFSSELLESIEDELGVYRISVSEIEESLGSRKLGSDIRTRLENYLSAGAQFVV